MVQIMGLLTQIQDNANNEYIQFYELIDTLGVFFDDEDYTVVRFLMGEDEFLDLNYYHVIGHIYKLKPTIKAFKPTEDMTATMAYDFLQDYIDGKNDDGETFDKYWFCHWKVSELLGLNIFKNIGLNENIFSHCRETAFCDKEWKPNNTTDQQTEIDRLTAENRALQAKIAELESQLASSKQLGAGVADLTTYQTPLMAIMNEVIHEFWLNYTDDKIPPKQELITRWIKQQHPNLTNNEIITIDRMARPPIAKSGRAIKR